MSQKGSSSVDSAGCCFFFSGKAEIFGCLFALSQTQIVRHRGEFHCIYAVQDIDLEQASSLLFSAWVFVPLHCRFQWMLSCVPICTWSVGALGRSWWAMVALQSVLAKFTAWSISLIWRSARDARVELCVRAPLFCTCVRWRARLRGFFRAACLSCLQSALARFIASSSGCKCGVVRAGSALIASASGRGSIYNASRPRTFICPALRIGEVCCLE